MKRSLKRLLSLLVAVMLLTAAACPVSLAAKSSGTCGKKAKWSYDSKKKTLTISGKGTVTGGWQNAVGSTKVSVVVKKGITGIDTGAFSNTKIKKISLPGTLKTIEGWAFSYAAWRCELPSSITIPKSVTSIGPYALAGKGLKTIKVQKGNKKFADVKGVLFNKKKTKLLALPLGKKGKYTIPNGTKELSEYAIFADSSLTTLIVPASVKKVDRITFTSCTFKELVFLSKNPPKGLTIDNLVKVENAFYRERYQDQWKSTVKDSSANGFAGKWWAIYTGKLA